jgi:hypothetical protein
MHKFILIALLLAGSAQAAEPVIAYTWDEAVTLSKQHGTPILIDFYTDW